MRPGMKRLLIAAATAALTVTASPLAVPEQLPLNVELQRPSSADDAPRKLTGKFLHITDLHLDRFYVPGSLNDDDEACHHGEGHAGYLGSPGSECDSPQLLIDQTFDWIDKNLRDELDFVVWTGDSARHDNDERIPRTENQIEEFNAAIANKFLEIFSHRDDHPSGTLAIPIVPNIGNNDIMPHNIFKQGPNRWTEKLSQLWKAFIPEEQRHTFIEGGWFHTEVIPNKLSVFSLNTLYFFDSNKAVDGCAQKSEPGYHQMEWLRVQLQLLRERGMKAILMGHVPPARSADKQAWDETCWQKYTLWLQQYRDVVVGGLYGHMNIDHFMFQDTEDVDIKALLEDEHVPPFVEENNYENFTVQSKTSYLSSLRDLWADLPTPPDSVFDDEWSFLEEDEIDATGKKKKKKEKKKKKKFFKKIGGEYAERFSLSLVSPSVVPNYYPTLRVIEYDITGLKNTLTWAEYAQVYGSGNGNNKQQQLWAEREIELLKKSKKSPMPDPPAKSAPPGPAYSRQPLSLLNYAQYYANISQAEKDSSNKPQLSYELEYHTEKDKIYKLPDLTMPSIYNLATRIGEGVSASSLSSDEADHILTQKDDEKKHIVEDDNNDDDEINSNKKKKKKKKEKKNKIWQAFIERAFVGFLTFDKIEDKL